MKYIILLLSLSVFFGCTETPNETPFSYNISLEGEVNFEAATPDTTIANLQLFIETDRLLVAETLTDTVGHYQFSNLTSGNYYINVSALGFSDFTISDIVLASNLNTTIDTVLLELVIPMEVRDVVIDGEIDLDWESSYINDHATNWGPNDFENLYIARDEENLYIAVSGQFSDSDNTVNIYIDKDYGSNTGINDFSTISGGDFGDHLRKNVTAPESFGADLAFSSGWSLSGDIGVVSLENTLDVHNNIIEDTNIEVNTSVIEFSIPFSAISEDGEIPVGNRIALVAIIGGGENGSFADDTIPQQEDFTGTFINVFSRGY
jgi:hypothetical protein